LEEVQAILRIRPELVNVVMAWNNEHTALHYAVLGRTPEMVRLLMERGADARAGISPHNDATSAITIATERGYALDAGARMGLRDDRLKSTALGWACRWGREGLALLFLDLGADPGEGGCGTLGQATGLGGEEGA
jgi:ankyrin repeat protein